MTLVTAVLTELTTLDRPASVAHLSDSIPTTPVDTLRYVLHRLRFDGLVTLRYHLGTDPAGDDHTYWRVTLEGRAVIEEGHSDG